MYWITIILQIRKIPESNGSTLVKEREAWIFNVNQRKAKIGNELLLKNTKISVPTWWLKCYTNGKHRGIILRLFSNTHWLEKNFLCTFKACFFTKVHKICNSDYSNENTSNGPFHFSGTAVVLEFLQISFLAYHFFITFIRKLTQVLILTLFFFEYWAV